MAQLSPTHTNPRMSTVDEQVRYLMQGTSFGDRSLAESMERELAERLTAAEKEGRPLRVYCGFDPRTSDLHIGHTVPIRKLRAFQELGHEVTFLVGTFTSLIGDPSDKDKRRAILTPEQAAENGRTYAEQAFRILDRSRTQVRYNHEWLSELTFEKIIDLASDFSLQQFLTRESFRRRWDAKDPVYLHETFYALMQAYDAFALDADVQIGGTDQLFNIITASRGMMTRLGRPPNIGIILDILPGTDGTVKMSKSLANHIPIKARPEEMYGKVMSIPDTAIEPYFRLATPLGPDEIDALVHGMESGDCNPRDVKMRLAREIVAVFHDDEAAVAAEEHFVRVFRAGQTPDRMPEVTLPEGTLVVELMVREGLAESQSDARRLIAGGAVRFNDEKIGDYRFVIPPADGAVLRVGKRRFLRIYTLG